jgi:hypothetical protein
MQLGDIVKLISPPLDEQSCLKFINYYIDAKKDHLLERWSDAITKYGKFLEITVRILYEYGSGDNTQYTCKRYIEEISKIKKLPKSLRVILPQIVESGYNIRNDRDAAHPSTKIDPNEIDCNYVSSACDWVLSEFLVEFGDKNRNEADAIIRSIITRKIPLTYETSDGNLIMLGNKHPIWLNAAILMYTSKRSMSVDELSKSLRQNKRNIYMQLYRRKDMFYLLPDGNYELLPPGMAEVDEALRS